MQSIRIFKEDPEPRASLGVGVLSRSRETGVAALLIVLFLATVSVFADCGAPPTLEFAKIPLDRPLTARERRDLMALFEGLSEMTEGVMDEVICGAGAYHAKRRWFVEVAPRITGEQLRLRTELEDRQRGVKKYSSIHYYLVDGRLRNETRNATGAVRLLSLDDGSLGFWRSWTRRKAGTLDTETDGDGDDEEDAVVVESSGADGDLFSSDAAAIDLGGSRINRGGVLARLTRSGKGWHLQRWYYQNGHLVGAEFWHLRP